MTQTPDATDVVHLSAMEMARQIAAGGLTSREVVEAHIRRIQQVNPLLNAVVVPLFEQARQEAETADGVRRRGEPLGPLHGVPVTIKECFHVAGTPATEGVPRFARETMPDDAPLVRRLRRAGAIILGKTNLPQLMLLHETDNPLYGVTNNPWNRARVPGGSSGGEAAIIAAGGSPLGLANDIGGSIRYPAHACGICGIKPTTLRLTNAGVRDNLRGMEAIRPQPGPLARRVEDLYPALRVLMTLEEGEIDPQMAPVPLGDPADVDIAALRIGFWEDDGFFSPSPAIARAVREAAEALRARGAHVEPFVPPDMQRCVSLYFGLLSADGAADAARIIGSDACDWRIKRLLRLGRMPGWLLSALRVGASALRQRRTAELLGMIGRQTADGYWRLSHARAEYAQHFFDAWSAARLDALICPPHALPALLHGSTSELPLAASYCYWANVLGVPAGVVPVTRVGAAEESARSPSRDRVVRAAAEVERGSRGLPVGVQVAARPWREDVALAVMQVLESDFQSHEDFPHTPVDPR